MVLKRIRLRANDDAAFEAALTRAVTAYGKLSHPAIAKVHAFFPADGRFVLMREHIDGLPLSRVSALLREAGHKLEKRVATYIAVRVFGALAAAHAAKVVHGNLNPANVLVSWDGTVHVADFAIGRVARRLAHPASERADVFAATLMVWELLTGNRASDARPEPEDFLKLDIDTAAREALRFGIERDTGRPGLSAELMMRALRGSVNEECERALLVMALEAVRPPPESEPSSPPDSESARDSRPSSHSEAYALIAPREARKAQDKSVERRSSPSCTREIVESAREIDPAPKSPQIVERSRSKGTPPPLTATKREALEVPGSAIIAAPLPPPRGELPSSAAVVLDALPPAPVKRPRPRARAYAGLAAIAAAMLVVGLAWRTTPLAPRAMSASAPPAPAFRISGAHDAPPPRAPKVTIATAPSSTPPALAPTPKTGELTINVTGRRIFIDGHLAGDGPTTLSLACGTHDVRIGSAGPVQSIAVPCGGEAIVGAK